MRRAITSAALVILAVAVPAGALTRAAKDAKQQCKVEYKAAKQQAKQLSTHSQRVDAKREAKARYNTCVDNAKHKA